MLDLSRKATPGGKHPSPWSLNAPPRVAGALPAVRHNEDDDTWVVDFQSALADGGSVVMELVVAGHAPEF
jgi:hypothetical protein